MTSECVHTSASKETTEEPQQNETEEILRSIKTEENNGQQGNLDDSLTKTSKENDDKEQFKWTKIFVGGLPFSSTDHVLQEHFEQYGDILEAVIIRDKYSGNSKGYGFVTMKDKEAAERATADAGPIIDGRKCNVNYAFLGAKKSDIRYNNLFILRSPPSRYHRSYPLINPPCPWGTNNTCGLPIDPSLIYANCMYNYYGENFYSNPNSPYRNPYTVPKNYKPVIPQPLEYAFAHPFPSSWPYGVAFAPGPSYGTFYFNPDHLIPNDSNMGPYVSQAAYRPSYNNLYQNSSQIDTLSNNLNRVNLNNSTSEIDISKPSEPEKVVTETEPPIKNEETVQEKHETNDKLDSTTS